MKRISQSRTMWFSFALVVLGALMDNFSYLQSVIDQRYYGIILVVIGGQVQVMIATFNSLLPFAKAGKIKMLAVTGSKRSDLLPEVPTFLEQGLPEFENLFPWYGVLAPAGTPKEIQSKLYKDFTEVMELEDVKKQLKDQGIFVNLLNADQLSSLMKSDMQRWKNVVTQAHITQD